MGQRPNELTPEAGPLHQWGAELRAWRTRRGLSLAELGRRIHHDPSNIARYERADRGLAPTIEFAEQVDQALDAGGALVRSQSHLAQPSPPPATTAEPDSTGAALRTPHGCDETDVAVSPFDVARCDSEQSCTSTDSVLDSEAKPDFVDFPELKDMSPLNRRSLLLNGLAVSALPVVGPDDRDRIGAAIRDARRYLDGSVVESFYSYLASCKAGDGIRTAGQTLPAVLAFLLIVERCASETRLSVRQQLLKVGSDGAEFAGWLYRDTGDRPRAQFWHDRAAEWAQESDNTPMQGYILLKKAQLAYDDRDPARMLTLSRAACRESWNLPPRVQAEAIQQEARAEAMLGASKTSIERKLSEAYHTLDLHSKDDERLSGHYCETLLNMQAAACYAEAGSPHRAVEIFEESLKPRSFSNRDYGYFLSWFALSLAMAGDPDQAARIGAKSARLADEASSQRTNRELSRVNEVLKTWQHRPAVRELRGLIP